MKVVLDTNVLISAFLFAGVSGEVFDFLAKNHEPIVSEFILHEFSQKCAMKFKIQPDMIEAMVEKLRRTAPVVKPFGRRPRVCRDTDDDEILWIAASCRAGAILTGDDDLLTMVQYDGIQIINPRQFKTKFMYAHESS